MGENEQQDSETAEFPRQKVSSLVEFLRKSTKQEIVGSGAAN
jgi:hypothetical protein